MSLKKENNVSLASPTNEAEEAAPKKRRWVATSFDIYCLGKRFYIFSFYIFSYYESIGLTIVIGGQLLSWNAGKKDYLQ
jgi:hypothetical protein